jgi:dihydroorotate dehydrogenase electron transfer subunit
MKQQTAIFRFARPTPPYWAVRFDAPNPPGPGMFVLADLGGALREALFAAGIDGEGFTAMVPPGHPVTHLLPGANVDMLGPLGRGFRLEREDRLLLVAEAQMLPPLLPLLDAAPSVALVLEASTRVQLPEPRRFPPAVELFLVTRDGSAGHLGPLESDDEAPSGLRRAASHLLELIAWAERVCFSCHPDRYPALAALVRQARLQPAPDFAQALMPVSMPCGVGACEICRIPTRLGERRACVDGPVFDLLDLEVASQGSRITSYD